VFVASSTRAMIIAIFRDFIGFYLVIYKLLRF
jgi:hypothetical protein